MGYFILLLIFLTVIFAAFRASKTTDQKTANTKVKSNHLDGKEDVIHMYKVETTGNHRYRMYYHLPSYPGGIYAIDYVVDPFSKKPEIYPSVVRSYHIQTVYLNTSGMRATFKIGFLIKNGDLYLRFGTFTKTSKIRVNDEVHLMSGSDTKYKWECQNPGVNTSEEEEGLIWTVDLAVSEEFHSDVRSNGLAYWKFVDNNKGNSYYGDIEGDSAARLSDMITLLEKSNEDKEDIKEILERVDTIKSEAL